MASAGHREPELLPGSSVSQVSPVPCTTLFPSVPACCQFFCCCCCCFALEMLQPQKLLLPVTCGDVKAQKVKVSLQPICDQPVSYQQHKSVPLDAWHSWAFGKPTTPIISSPWPGTFGPPWEFWTPTSLSVWFLQSSSRSAWVSDSMWFSHRWRGKSWIRWDLCTVYQDKGRRLPLGSFSFIGVQLQLQSNNKNSPTLKKSN